MLPRRLAGARIPHHYTVYKLSTTCIPCQRARCMCRRAACTLCTYPFAAKKKPVRSEAAGPTPLGKGSWPPKQAPNVHCVCGLPGSPSASACIVRAACPSSDRCHACIWRALRLKEAISPACTGALHMGERAGGAVSRSGEGATWL